MEQLLWLVAGVVLGVTAREYVHRPKLAVVGSGGGDSGPMVVVEMLRVSNQPGFWGVRLGKTVVFGKTLFKKFEKGLSIDRNPAHECIAWMKDKESGQHVSTLWWKPTGRPADLSRTVTIHSGEEYDLYLFARDNSEPLKYFTFETDDPTQWPPVPRVPSDELKFDETRVFAIEIKYSYDKQTLRFEAKVERGFDGRLTFRTTGGGGTF